MQFYYWLSLNVGLAIAMFFLVPVERIRQLTVYGLIGGTGLSVVTFALARLLNLWEIIGTLEIGEYIHVLPSLAWFFPVVIFGHFFPKTGSLLIRAGYVMLFAGASVLTQLLFAYLGMWRDIHWNPFYTLALATFTHTLLAVYITHTEQYLPE